MRLRGFAMMGLIFLAGCGGGGGTAPIPSADEAKKSLQTTLDAWKAGQPPASLDAGTPKIEAVDFDWVAGKKLTEFAIGEESPEAGTKTFDVKITLAPGGVRDVKYMVLGKDPVLVYRDEDFRRMLNMEDDPQAKLKTRKGRR